jgi:MFS family permease
MHGYDVVLFLHVIGAIGLVGSSLVAPLLAVAVRRTSTVSSLREWAAFTRRLGQAVGPFAGLTLVTGLVLGFWGDWWGSGWLEVSLALFIVAGALATTVLDPWARRLVDAAEAAPDGPVTAELDRARRDPRATVAEPVLLGTDVAIVFLMTVKPGVVGALVIAAIGLCAGALLAARERRHDELALSRTPTAA